MLRIRKAQMDALSKYMLKQFEDRMIVHLRSTFPEQTQNVPEPVLRATIRTGIDSAATYDVTDEADVQRYLGCVVLYGPDFDTNPKTGWAGQILCNKDLSGTEKMNQIDDYELFASAGNQL
jgi:hypothetical protein